MEITKTEKFDISQIRASVGSRRTVLTTRIVALDVGEGFVVEGVDRESLVSRISALRKDGRKFTTKKLGDRRFQVVRLA